MTAATSISDANGLEVGARSGTHPPARSPSVTPSGDLVIYPDAGHGGIFQFHHQFVEKALAFLSHDTKEFS